MSLDDLVNKWFESDHCYDRAGEPITLARYMDLKRDHDYRKVARDTVHGVIVSTIWLGRDMGNWPSEDPNYRPVIFETLLMVDDDAWSGIDCLSYRYHTEAEALAGHAKTVRALGRVYESGELTHAAYARAMRGEP